MKKIFKILAVTATAACVVGLAACSASASKLSLDSFWYIDTYRRIQNSAIGTREVLVYDVTLDEDTQGNNGTFCFHLDTSKDHSYTTIFGVGVYDWSDYTFVELTESNKADYANANGGYSAGANQEIVYYYQTELLYSGNYVYDSDPETEATADNSIAFESEITTTTYFRSAQDDLEPLYSYTYAHTTVPNSNIPSKVSEMCQELEYEYEVFYNEDCTEAECTYTNKLDSDENYTKTVSVGSDYSYFDNNQLYAAIRGMNLSDSFSETISLYIPADGGMVDVSVAGTETTELDAVANETIVNALTAAYGQSDLTGSEDDSFTATYHSYIRCTAVSIVPTGDYTGVTREAWYTYVENESNNQYRATLVYFTNPLSYNLGTLEYTLTEVQEVIAPNI